MSADPDYKRKQRTFLVRRRRQVIYMNDNEMIVIAQSCERFGVRRDSAIDREILMEKILAELDNNLPALF